jgi:prophage regulatory protein
MKVLRLPDVQDKTGLRHSSIYKGVKERTFPAPIALGPKARGWLEAEVERWIADQVAKRDGGKAV